jgi:hypothetical protein
VQLTGFLIFDKVYLRYVTNDAHHHSQNRLLLSLTSLAPAGLYAILLFQNTI